MPAAKVPTIGDLELLVAGLKGDVKVAETAHDALVDKYDDAQSQIRSLNARLEAATKDADFERSRATALEARMQRMSGYLDRVLDEEDRLEKPDMPRMQPPTPVKGPAINDIPMPRPETKNSHMDFAYRSTSDHDRFYPSRRY